MSLFGAHKSLPPIGCAEQRWLGHAGPAPIPLFTGRQLGRRRRRLPRSEALWAGRYLQAVIVLAPFAARHNGLGDFLERQIGKFGGPERKCAAADQQRAVIADLIAQFGENLRG